MAMQLLDKQTSLRKLSRRRLPLLRTMYDDKQIVFIASMLSEEHFRKIDDMWRIILNGKQGENNFGLGLADYFLFSEVEFVMEEMYQDALAIDREYHPEDLEHYSRLQVPWVKEEITELSSGLEHDPTLKELYDATKRNESGLRYRLYYYLKFPEKMKKREIL